MSKQVDTVFPVYFACGPVPVSNKPPAITILPSRRSPTFLDLSTLTLTIYIEIYIDEGKEIHINGDNGNNNTKVSDYNII